MESAVNIAKFFIKNGLDTNRNTFDGNMKLQKLLFFANLISLSERGEPLFPEPILAFKNGCVVESIRLKYKDDNKNFVAESQDFQPDFQQSEQDVLNLTIELFGDVSARELSALNHSFKFWKEAFERSRHSNGYKEKELAVVETQDMLKEIDKIKDVIDIFKDNQGKNYNYDIVNGIKFNYDEDLTITDAILEQLEDFSQKAEDKIYTLYLDNGNLVIY